MLQYVCLQKWYELRREVDGDGQVSKKLGDDEKHNEPHDMTSFGLGIWLRAIRRPAQGPESFRNERTHTPCPRQEINHKRPKDMAKGDERDREEELSGGAD